MIEKYLSTRYVKGGRGPIELDCYGLVRLARSELFGKPLMPLCTEAVPGRFRAITGAVESVSSLLAMRPVDRTLGAVATAWRGTLCVHVGLVVEADGREWILETDEPGPRLTPPRLFEKRYTSVIYYDD